VRILLVSVHFLEDDQSLVVPSLRTEPSRLLQNVSGHQSNDSQLELTVSGIKGHNARVKTGQIMPISSLIRNL
jgi:hypothetical protein